MRKFIVSAFVALPLAALWQSSADAAGCCPVQIGPWCQGFKFGTEFAIKTWARPISGDPCTPVPPGCRGKVHCWDPCGGGHGGCCGNGGPAGPGVAPGGCCCGQGGAPGGCCGPCYGCGDGVGHGYLKPWYLYYPLDAHFAVPAPTGYPNWPAPQVPETGHYGPKAPAHAWQSPVPLPGNPHCYPNGFQPPAAPAAPAAPAPSHVPANYTQPINYYQPAGYQQPINFYQPASSYQAPSYWYGF